MRRESYFDLLFVLELDAGARHVQAFQELGEALDHQQQARERYHALERPKDRPPRRLVGNFPELEGTFGLVPADVYQHRETREEEDDVGDRVDQASGARRARVPEEI